MKQLSITTKIWLSVSIFVIGYVFSTGLNQFQTWEARTSLRVTSESLFPAAQHAQEAENAFERMVKDFSDSVVTQDLSGLDRATLEGQKTVELLNEISSISDLPSGRTSEAEKLASLVSQLQSDGQQVYRPVIAGSMTPESQQQVGDLAKRINAAKTSLGNLKEETSSDIKPQLSSMETRSLMSAESGFMVFLATLVIAGVLVSLTIKRSIVRPIAQAISELSESAQQIAGAASQVSGSSQALAQGSSEQAASLEETSSSSEEINSMARKNSDNAGVMTHLVATSQSEFADTNRQLGAMITAMDDINSSSAKISRIIKVIDEIAFQTNILALNAAVEAARAGEAGMGFAVVADEVRNLAQRSAQAAKDTADLIEDSIDKAGSGKTKVGLVAASIRRITEESEKIKILVDEVSHGSREQSEGIEQIGKALSQMEHATQSTAASAEESAAAAEEMSAQSEALEDIVKRLDLMVFGYGHLTLG